MHRDQFAPEPTRRPVTEDEAVAMIELHSRIREQSAGSTLDLQDVIESLEISEAEGLRLLAQVRAQAPKERRPMPTALAIVLYSLLALSLVWAAAACYFIGGSAINHSHFEALDALGLLVSLAWIVGWLRYLRPRILRASFSLRSRFPQTR